MLNTGTLKELKALHKIGQKRAQLILTARQAKPFQTVVSDVVLSEGVCMLLLLRALFARSMRVVLALAVYVPALALMLTGRAAGVHSSPSSVAAASA